MRIRLAEDDRERLGAPDVIEIDLARLGAMEAIALQKATGLRPPEWFTALDAGDSTAIVAAVWLGLDRAGVKIRFSELDFNLLALRFPPADPDEAGDDDPKAPASTSSGDSGSTPGPSPAG